MPYLLCCVVPVIAVVFLSSRVAPGPSDYSLTLKGKKKALGYRPNLAFIPHPSIRRIAHACGSSI